MNPRFDLPPPPFEQCQEKLHYWHRGVLRGRGRCVEMHMNMFSSNETGGRDFPTFDIYCGPSLDPSYLCSLNSFKIVSESCLHESASSICKHNKIHFFFRTSILSLRLLQQAVRAMVREGSDWSIYRFPAVREL